MSNSELRGAPCPLTGRTVADELQHAVAMLQCEKVGERDGVRYNADEYRAYCDGWYFGIARALAVMITAIDRRATRLETFPPAALDVLHDHHGVNDARDYGELTGPAAPPQSASAADGYVRGRPRGAARDGHQGDAGEPDLHAGRSCRGHSDGRDGRGH